MRGTGHRSAHRCETSVKLKDPGFLLRFEGRRKGIESNLNIVIISTLWTTDYLAKPVRELPQQPHAA